MHAASSAWASPQMPPWSSASGVLAAKHEAASYMTSSIILTVLLCGMNISPFLWRGERGLFNALKKYIAASVVKISSWQVTWIYRREKKSFKLVSLWCGFFSSLLIAFILISKICHCKVNPVTKLFFQMTKWFCSTHNSGLMMILPLFKYNASEGQLTLWNSEIFTGSFQEFPKWCFQGLERLSKNLQYRSF